MTEAEIRDVIASTIRIELAPSDVRVNVRERENYDDDRVFVVTVSIATDCPPDDRKMLGLIRKIRTKLDEAKITEGFPMLSFIANYEEQNLGLEFA